MLLQLLSGGQSCKTFKEKLITTVEKSMWKSPNVIIGCIDPKTLKMRHTGESSVNRREVEECTWMR